MSSLRIKEILTNILDLYLQLKPYVSLHLSHGYFDFFQALVDINSNSKVNRKDHGNLRARMIFSFTI